MTATSGKCARRVMSWLGAGQRRCANIRIALGLVRRDKLPRNAQSVIVTGLWVRASIYTDRELPLRAL
jgi:hypothetical protein